MNQKLTANKVKKNTFDGESGPGVRPVKKDVLLTDVDPLFNFVYRKNNRF
jgi:hypothetical protein